MTCSNLTLDDIRAHFPEVEWHNYYNTPVRGIFFDSRHVENGGVFVSTSGRHHNGMDLSLEDTFIQDALAKGAKAVITDHTHSCKEQVTLGIVPDVKLALSRMAALCFGNPQLYLTMVGITGTNGKTTTSSILQEMLLANFVNTGLLGTIYYRYGKKKFPANLTTPDPVTFYKHLREMVDANVSHVVMEVSSHALAQSRVAGIDFHAGIFTNATRDHLDYHKTWEHYLDSKALLFRSLRKDAYAVVNIDDAASKWMLEDCCAQVISFAIEKPAMITARNIHFTHSQGCFELVTPQGNIEIVTNMLGKHNVYNCLAAAACATTLGLSLEQIKQGIEAVETVPGRMEMIQCGQPFQVFVDYAHTPDALEKALVALRESTPGKIHVVFGCGGERDPGKRPQMGMIAGNLADIVCITNDNPRRESPKSIALQIASEISPNKECQICLDREQAIFDTLAKAAPGDSVLIAGKGHESLQIIGNQQFSFDDREVARKSLQKLGY